MNSLQKEINDLSDREAMGLNENYQSTMSEILNEDFKRMATIETSRCLSVLQSASVTFRQRWAAGSILGMTQDPRIHVYQPEMISLPHSTVPIGLAERNLEEINGDLESLGIKKEWIAKECPRHTVKLNAYLIGKYPITNSEYLHFLRENPKEPIPSSWEFGIYPNIKSNHPVYSIPFEAAQMYCDWLSKETGRNFRLPSEAEWEFAAAGPNQNEYPWGNRWIESIANTAELGLYQSTPVGIFPGGRSWCGAFDMAGNVEEYTADKYHVYPGGQLIEDDIYLRLGAYPVARGGSFTRFRDLARCKRRHGAYPKEIYVMGFRIAETPSS